MRYLSVLAILLTLVSCDKDIFVSVEPQMIVEGWIDADGFPMVILTESVVIEDNDYKEYSDLNKYMIKWAKVTVCDGEEEVVLTGKGTKDYFPPYIYTTTRMRGVAGKRYKLTVEYKDYYAEAETVIPEKISLDSMAVKYCNDKDSLFYIDAFFTDPLQKKNYYKFFTKVVERDSFYLSSDMAVLDDAQFSSSNVSVAVCSGSTIYDESDRMYFGADEKVLLKFVHIDSAAYSYWDMYKDVKAFSRNPLFPYSRNLPSNISGAYGYWFGYGSTEYMVDMKQNESVSHDTPSPLNFQ